MKQRESSDMQFVDDGAVPRRSERLIGAPSERGVGDNALQHARSTVSAIEREVPVLMAYAIPEKSVVPLEAISNLLGIRVQQQFVRVKALPIGRVMGTVDS